MTRLAGVSLRRATAQDAEALAALMGDEAVFPGMLNVPYPSVEAWRKRLEAQAVDEDSLHLLALAEGRVIGSAAIHRFGWTARRHHVGGLVIMVAGGWQGRGVGSLMMTSLLDWADNWAGLLRIELNVYADNDAARHVYGKFGFVREGTQQAWALRAGRYVDAIAMARLHPSPPQLSLTA